MPLAKRAYEARLMASAAFGAYPGEVDRLSPLSRPNVDHLMGQGRRPELQDTGRVASRSPLRRSNRPMSKESIDLPPCMLTMRSRRRE